MKITRINNADAAVPEFAIEGALDTLEAPRFIEILTQAVTSETKGLIVDCTEMPYLTSTGLRAFMIIGKAVMANGGKLIPCGLDGLALEIFCSSGFSQVFPPADTVSDARMQFNQ
ncbi:MAG: STAS domain-containing protein [Desulfovibrionaceae bacterium]|nr:STAS domain-containing protein [Desulfovibrionaceae bacterium]